MYKTIKQKYSLFFFFKLILPVFQLSSNKKHIKNIKPNETANNSFLYLFPNGNIGICIWPQPCRPTENRQNHTIQYNIVILCHL